MLSLGENSLKHIEFPEEDFDWMADPADFRHSPGLAIYLNPEGSVVIRQYHDSGDDRCVIIRIEDAKKVAKAIVGAANGQEG